MKLQSAFNFIVTPKNGQYNNTREVDGVEIRSNTSIEEAADVSREAIVLEVPYFYEGDIQVGDTVIIHFNVFRVSYNDQGIPRQSNFHLTNNLFYVEPDMIYMAIRGEEKFSIDNAVFVAPVFEETKWEGTKEVKHVGIVKYPNSFLKSQGVTEDTKVIFRKNCEFEHIINGERLYKMANHRILSTLN